MIAGRWSLDFVSDQLTDGRRFRILAIVDDCTRECLALAADTSLSGVRVAGELDRLMIERDKPKMIVSDNGSELTSNAILAWADKTKVEWHYIAPGKPMQNAFIESFNGRLQWLRASPRRSPRPTRQLQPPERTHAWIKLGGKVSGFARRTDATDAHDAPVHPAAVAIPSPRESVDVGSGTVQFP
jgi:transposase InsO family protein